MPIDFYSNARKELKALPFAIQGRILAKLDWVEQDLDARLDHLVGGRPKIRVGDYRILCRRINTVLFITNICHRKNVYDEKRHA